MNRTGKLRRVVSLVGATTLAVLVGLSTPGSATAAPSTSPSVQAQSSPAPDGTPQTHPVLPVCQQPSEGKAGCMLVMRTDVQGPLGLLPEGESPIGYGPSDLQDAYNLPSTTPGLGAGETVAIVDAFDNPKAEEDLAVYRAQFGLPPCTTANGCFRKVDQRGGTAYPLADTGWAAEIALDLDMVSAICPQCNILLVEADDDSFASLFAAEQTAIALGAKFVSNSWGGPESPSEETTDEQVFDHPGVAITASTGDRGFGVQYPAASKYVTAVGGTSLTHAPSVRGWSEGAWSGAGSGCSVFDSKPSFQTDTGCSQRTLADVSAVADPVTGVAAYDSFGSAGWLVLGGTSVGAPLIAATYALAGVPGSIDYANSYPYGAPAGTLYDVTAGSNGPCGTYLCSARPGYDGPTGLGTPNGIDAFRSSGPHGLISGTVTDSVDGHPLAGAHVTAGPATAITDGQGRYVVSLPVGTYDMTVTGVFGYGDASATGVVVSDGVRTVQDFTMAREPTVTVSGTVADGSGHGWPLYAKVEATGTPVPPVFTDPFTGVYHLTLPANASYTLRITAQSPGYQVTNVPIQAGDTDLTKDVSVSVDTVACNAPGYAFQYGGLAKEPFDSSSGPPPGWTVTDATGVGGWVFNDPASRGNRTGGTGNFAIVDSDFIGANKHEDTSLITPPIDLTGVSAPEIGFDTDFLPFSATVGDVDVSTDGGTTWTTVWHHSFDTVPGPSTQTVPIPQAAGQSNVRVRFHYSDTWGFWWQVDNVYVGKRSCAPLAGGIVAGQVTDANTGAAVSGATVTSTDTPSDKATSVATPDDPNLGDGFYTLFASVTGSHPFAGSKSRYTPTSVSVNVVADSVTRADIALRAGHVVVTPGEITTNQDFDTTTTRQVTFSNDGTAPVTVDLEEHGGSASLTPTGAPIQNITGTFSPYWAGSGSEGDPVPASVAPHTEPWLPLADFPTVVMDNAVGVADDGKVYSFGGVLGAATGAAASEVYDPATQTWSPIPEMSIQRDKPSVAYVDGKFYVIGGWDVDTGAVVSTTEIFDPATGTWSTGAPNPRPHAASAAAVLNGKIYVVGGCNAASCGVLDVMVYDPVANTWTQAQRYPQATSWEGCGALGGHLYCAGGTTDFGDTRNAYSYDPATNTWTALPTLPIDLWAMAAVAADGELVLSGGVTNGNTTITNQGFAFDPRVGQWEPIPNADTALYRSGAACGMVTVGGSTGGFNAVSTSTELPGLDNCDGSFGVNWLSENTTHFTIQPGQSVTVTTTLDSTGPLVTMPGPYTAQLAVNTDSPYTVSPVGMTMIVNPPASSAQIVGTVVGLDCSGTVVHLPGATVTVALANSTFTVRTDATSTFSVWLAAPSGTVTFASTMPGWQPATTATTVAPGDLLITVLVASPDSCP